MLQKIYELRTRDMRNADTLFDAAYEYVMLLDAIANRFDEECEYGSYAIRECEELRKLWVECKAYKALDSLTKEDAVLYPTTLGIAARLILDKIRSFEEASLEYFSAVDGVDGGYLNKKRDALIEAYYDTRDTMCSNKEELEVKTLSVPVL